MMAETMTACERDPVKQFSIFTENRLGRLHDLTSVLAKQEVHVMAIATLDTTDSAIVRLVLDLPDRARKILQGRFPFTEREILAVEIDSEHRLNEVLAAVVMAEINIYYVYSFLIRPRGQSAMALNVEDPDVASEIFEHSGIKVLSQADIAR